MSAPTPPPGMGRVIRELRVQCCVCQGELSIPLETGQQLVKGRAIKFEIVDGALWVELRCRHYGCNTENRFRVTEG